MDNLLYMSLLNPILIYRRTGHGAASLFNGTKDRRIVSESPLLVSLMEGFAFSVQDPFGESRSYIEFVRR